MTFVNPRSPRRVLARVARLAAALAVLAAPAAGTAGAQATRKAEQDADARALAAYRLDDAKIGRWIRAQEEILAYSRDHEAELKALEKTLEADERGGDDDAGGPTLAEMSKRIERIAPFREALQRAGTTSRDFMLTSLVMFQTAFAAEMQKSGTITELPKEVPAAHVALYHKYAAQFKKLSDEQKALEKRREANEEEEEDGDPAA